MVFILYLDNFSKNFTSWPTLYIIFALQFVGFFFHFGPSMKQNPVHSTPVLVLLK